MSTLKLKCVDEDNIEVEASDNGALPPDAPSFYLGINNYENILPYGGYSSECAALSYSDVEKLRDCLDNWLKEKKDANDKCKGCETGN